MTKEKLESEVKAISESGLAATGRIRDLEVEFDETRDQHPDSLERLVTAYASDYITALRVATDLLDADGLGRIEVDATIERTTDNDLEIPRLESLRFHVRVERTLDGMSDTLEKSANRLSKVEDVVSETYRPEITIEDDAF